MIKIKEGFKGERLVSLPDELLQSYMQDPLIKSLYLRKIGFFPRVKFHYVQKESGADYAMIIYCTDGKGWVEIDKKRYEIDSGDFIFIPSSTPYAFGADESSPWTIYWMHFSGTMAGEFVPSIPQSINIEPSTSSRIQERLELFEEIYCNFEIAYTRDHMAYVTTCLYRFLASFSLMPQYRYIKSYKHDELALSAMIIRYMQENIGQNITLEQLCQKFKYSQSHLSALFQKETGMSPINYFIRLKIQKACEYIELSGLKLHEISTKLGYTEPTYFSRIFTKVMGISPSEYKKRESENSIGL